MTNRNAETSPSLLWETLKANIRGTIISYTAHANKQRFKRQQELVALITDLDRRYAIAPTPELHKDRLSLQTEYNLLTTRDAEQLLLRTRGALYEHGDKAGCLLAHQLKSRSASRLIPQICDSSDLSTTYPERINEAFMSFYSQLDISESPEDTSMMSDFFSNQTIPQISADDCHNLEQS